MSARDLDALPEGFDLDGYRLGEVLGAGGFGITYKAVDTQFDHPVAIKEYFPRRVATRVGLTVRPVAAREEEAYEWGLKRFRKEAKALFKLHHTNIVPVRRYLEANGTAYLVMAFEEGESLRQYRARKGALDEAAIRRLLVPLLDGITAVHDAGVLHRDIKPDNIYIRADGTPVLIDFGAARYAVAAHSTTVSSHPIVSPGYSPYEQYSTSADQGPWTDIYALGATLYALIAGERPPDANGRIQGVAMTPASVVGHGHYSAALLSAIDQALALKPEDRPHSIPAWRAMIEASDSTLNLEQDNGKARRTPMDRKARPPAPRSPVRRWVAALGVLAVLGFAGYAATGGMDRIIAWFQPAPSPASGSPKPAPGDQQRQEQERRAEEDKRRIEEQRRADEERARADEQRRAEQQRQRNAAEAVRLAEAAASRAREAQSRALAAQKRARDARAPARASAARGRAAAAQGRAGAEGYYVANHDSYFIRYEGQRDLEKGYGTLYYRQGGRFEGLMTKFAERSGTFLLTSNDRVEGEFEEDGKGNAVWISANGTLLYEGQWCLNLTCYGVRYWPGDRPDQGRYEGEIMPRAGKPNGSGVFTFNNGSRYEGDVVNQKMEGWGIMVNASGERQAGRWRNDGFVGTE